MMEFIIYVITDATILLIIIALRRRWMIQKQEAIKWYPEKESDADVGHIILHTKNGEGEVLVNEKLQRDYAMDEKSFEEIILDINPSFYDDYELTKKEKPERNAEYYRNKQEKAYNDMIPKWEKRAKEVVIEIMNEIDEHTQDFPLDTSYELLFKGSYTMLYSDISYIEHWFEYESNEVRELVEKEMKSRGFSFKTPAIGAVTISWDKDPFTEMSDSIGDSDDSFYPKIEKLRRKVLELQEDSSEFEALAHKLREINRW